MLPTPAVEWGRTMLATLPTVFKRALSVVAECPIGRSGTLQTACQGKSPAESGTAVGVVPASSDAEPGSSALNKRGAGSPERGTAE